VQIYLGIIGLWVANAIALHVNIRRYVTGMDVKSANLDADIEWWWEGALVAPMGVWLIGTVSFGVLLLTVAGAFGVLPALKRPITRIETIAPKF
jgi:hypothetical protein